MKDWLDTPREKVVMPQCLFAAPYSRMGLAGVLADGAAAGAAGASGGAPSPGAQRPRTTRPGPRGPAEDPPLVADLNEPTRPALARAGLTVEELEDLLRHDELAVIATDVGGSVTQWNPAAERLYGWTRAEVLGRPITEITVGPQDSGVAEAIMAAVRQTGRWEGEFWVHRRDGTRFLARVREAVIADETGTPVGLVGVSIAAGGAREPART